MTISAAKTTELQAVNIVLSTIGEPPVTDTGTSDSTNAEAVLQEVYLQVLSTGWVFNTRKHKFTTDSASEIVVNDSVVSIDADSTDSNDYTIRGNKVYIRSLNTTVFTQGAGHDVTLDIVELLPWSSLPETARQYIAKRAGRVLVQRYLPDSNVLRSAVADEQIALAVLHREELRIGNHSILKNSNVGYPRSIVERVL